MSIQPLAPLAPLSPLSPLPQATGTGTGTGTDFTQFLKDALNQVNDLQNQADSASMQLATGQIQDISTVMVSLEKANLSLSTTVSVRDKVIDAYNQIMRMQL